MGVAVVTGANRGIGLELARQLGARGTSVVAACRRCSPELGALGVRVESGVDVTGRARDLGMIEADESARGLLQRIDELRLATTGRFLAPEWRSLAVVRRAFCALLLLLAVSWPASADDGKRLTAILLVARAELPDSNFRDSVVLVMNNIGPAPGGLIINRPTSIAVASLFPDLERLAQLDDKVYFGGPVALTSVSFLFRAETPPEHATQVLDGVCVSTDLELLRKLLSRDKPADGLRIFIGYAGWAPRQLEAEIARGDWTLTPAEPDAIFGRRSEHPWPERRTQRAAFDDQAIFAMARPPRPMPPASRAPRRGARISQLAPDG